MAVSTNLGSWTALSNETWCEVTLAEGKFTVSADANDALAARPTATVTVTAGEGERSITREVRVTQGAQTFTDLSAAGRANCYIVAPKSASVFDAAYKGNSSTESIGAAEGAELVWQSAQGLVTRVAYAADEKKIIVETADKSGNAVVAAVDESGTILWSWHLWIVDYDPSASLFTTAPNASGTTWSFMDRNLGALTVERGSFDSHGLLYQWGRKDPFVGPRYYNMADSADAQVYDSQNLRVYPEYAATDAERGAAGYASAHAMTFITGTKESGYNWLQTADASLWGTEKNNNDPCPRGWKVPSKEVFAALHIKDVISPELEKNYGFTLSDGTNEAFFPGAGRRSFYTGALTNMNDNEVRPTPWTGYYWSSTGEGKEAYAMDFSFDINGTRAGSSFQGAALQYAAGGMQVRCVKIR